MNELPGQNFRNKKIVIYGAGHMLERYKEIINWDNVVAVLDRDVGKQRKNMNVIPPEKIMSLTYDYVIIFSDQYFESIKNILIGEFFVSQQKIISWKIFLTEDQLVSDEMAGFYKGYIEEQEAHEVLDIGGQRLCRYFFSNEPLEFRIDSLGKKNLKLYSRFYENTYDSINERKVAYDFVLIWDDYRMDIEWDCLAKVSKRYIIWTIPYSYIESEGYSENMDKLEGWGEKQIFLFSDGVVYVFEKKCDARKSDCEIFVVTHKKYNVLSNDIYMPIYVGNKYNEKNCYTDHTGDNIAYLNDRINECTALYWIWKNTASKYVGLNHYRRYFYNNDIKNSANYLNDNKIVKIFDRGYDIILPCLTRLSRSVLENIRSSIGEDLCAQALMIMRNMFEKKVPDYMDAFEYVMSGNAFYKCNIFVTRRELLDAYCGWLFSFLIEAAEMLDVSSYDSHHKRTIGYFAETMLTVWLLKQNVRIKELPITDV